MSRISTRLAEFAGPLAILPGLVRKPRDKAKVETGVLIVERVAPTESFLGHSTRRSPS